MENRSAEMQDFLTEAAEFDKRIVGAGLVPARSVMLGIRRDLCENVQHAAGRHKACPCIILY